MPNAKQTPDRMPPAPTMSSREVHRRADAYITRRKKTPELIQSVLLRELETLRGAYRGEIDVLEPSIFTGDSLCMIRLGITPPFPRTWKCTPKKLVRRTKLDDRTLFLYEDYGYFLVNTQTVTFGPRGTVVIFLKGSIQLEVTVTHQGACSHRYVICTRKVTHQFGHYLPPMSAAPKFKEFRWKPKPHTGSTCPPFPLSKP